MVQPIGVEDHRSRVDLGPEAAPGSLRTAPENGPLGAEAEQVHARHPEEHDDAVAGDAEIAVRARSRRAAQARPTGGAVAASKGQATAAQPRLDKSDDNV
jgi:hypothetical protein